MPLRIALFLEEVRCHARDVVRLLAMLIRTFALLTRQDIRTGVILRDPRQPQKSLFPDIMPVGREIPFNPGKPAGK